MVKLPALYVLDPLKPGFIEAMPSPGQFVGYDPARISKYVPARECKTCRYWADCGTHFDCIAGNGCSECPPDGSGFCHNHEGRT